MALRELMIANPKLSVIAISILVTFIMTLVTKKLTDQNKMKELKEIQKSCQIKIKSGNLTQDEMSKINKQMMECTWELTKHSFKPTLITLIPFLVLFIWIRGIYQDTFSSWIWWYIGTSIIFSIIFRKILKVV